MDIQSGYENALMVDHWLKIEIRKRLNDVNFRFSFDGPLEELEYHFEAEKDGHCLNISLTEDCSYLIAFYNSSGGGCDLGEGPCIQITVELIVEDFLELLKIKDVV